MSPYHATQLTLLVLFVATGAVFAWLAAWAPRGRWYLRLAIPYALLVAIGLLGATSLARLLLAQLLTMLAVLAPAVVWSGRGTAPTGEDDVRQRRRLQFALLDLL